MKVIGTDNFARDYNGGRSETVEGENLSQEAADRLADSLNKRYGGPDARTYYVVRPDDYKHYIFDGY